MKARSVTLTIREKVEAELERIVATSVIKSVCFSEWASLIVPVLKRKWSSSDLWGFQTD